MSNLVVLTRFANPQDLLKHAKDFLDRRMSSPIEVGFLIGHNKSAEDNKHSHPATLQVNKSSNLIFASTNLTGSTPQQTFGNMDFVIDQLVFHSTNNRKFTVTYAIDADAKDVTKR